MSLRPTPPVATWFLNQFGPASEAESELGDLVEQYQRGHGPIWYWRQVLAIVYGELYQQFRNHKRQFVGAFVSAWCVWGVLQFTAGVILMLRYVLLLPNVYQFEISVFGFPFLRLQSGRESIYATQWEFIVFTLALNALTLVLAGRFCVGLSRIHPRSMLLAYVTTYIVCAAGWMVTNLLTSPQHQQIQFRDLAALPLMAALIFLGGRRGLSPLPPRIEGEKA